MHDIGQKCPFHLVIATRQCYKLFDCGQLVVAIRYTEFQAIFSPPPEISVTQRASFPLGWTPLNLTVSLAVCQTQWYIQLRSEDLGKGDDSGEHPANATAGVWYPFH